MFLSGLRLGSESDERAERLARVSASCGAVGGKGLDERLELLVNIGRPERSSKLRRLGPS